MVTLALDSTTPAGSLAIARDGRVLLARTGDATRPHGERLPGDVIALLGDAGVDLGEVTLYAVATGPGAFTGLRIGIAAIQGLSFARGVPVVGVSALDALARAASDAASPAPGTRIGTWMDAARHEVFAALYEVAGLPRPGAPAPILLVDPPSVASPTVVLARWAAREGSRVLQMVGEGALRYRGAVDAAFPAARVLDAWPPLASAMVPLALDAAARGLAGPPHAIRPLYVRRPDAEITRDLRAASDAGAP